MNKMTYKTFTWPRNPEHYRQTYVREPEYGRNAAGDPVFTGMGPKKLTVTGSGAFSGDTAYTDFKALAELFIQPEAGELAHPVWGKVTAYFTELELTQEPREDYVAYRFTFRGTDENGGIPK